MPGRIFSLGKNKWQIVVEAGRHPVTGKLRRIHRIFYGSKREAKKEKAHLEMEVAQGKHASRGKITIGEYLSQWLKTHVAQLAPTTQRRYKEIVNKRIIPLIGTIPLSELRPSQIKNFYREVIKQGRLDGRRGGLSQESLTYVHRVLHKALNSAVEDEIIQHNPASAVTIPKISAYDIDDDDEETNARVLTSQQVETMLEAAKKTHYYPMLFLEVRTGLRRGELLGLRWQDIDWERRTISVRQTVSYTPEMGIHIKKKLKTKKSRRTIDVSKEVLAVLKQHQKEQEKLKMRHGQKYQDHDLIFCQPNGKPLHPDTISSWFPEFLESIGLPRLNFHCLRHTHASLLLQAGVDIKVISERLGHSSTRITYDIYSHLMPGMQKEAVDKLENLLKR